MESTETSVNTESSSETGSPEYYDTTEYTSVGDPEPEVVEAEADDTELQGPKTYESADREKMLNAAVTRSSGFEQITNTQDLKNTVKLELEQSLKSYSDKIKELSLDNSDEMNIKRIKLEEKLIDSLQGIDYKNNSIEFIELLNDGNKFDKCLISFLLSLSNNEDDRQIPRDEKYNVEDKDEKTFNIWASKNLYTVLIPLSLALFAYAMKNQKLPDNGEYPLSLKKEQLMKASEGADYNERMKELRGILKNKEYTELYSLKKDAPPPTFIEPKQSISNDIFKVLDIVNTASTIWDISVVTAAFIPGPWQAAAVPLASASGVRLSSKAAALAASKTTLSVTGSPALASVVGLAASVATGNLASGGDAKLRLAKSVGRTRNNAITNLLYENAAAAEEGMSWASSMKDNVDGIRKAAMTSGQTIGTDTSLIGKIQAKVILNSLSGKSGYEYNEALRPTAREVMKHSKEIRAFARTVITNLPGGVVFDSFSGGVQSLEPWPVHVEEPDSGSESETDDYDSEACNVDLNNMYDLQDIIIDSKLIPDKVHKVKEGGKKDIPYVENIVHYRVASYLLRLCNDEYYNEMYKAAKDDSVDIKPINEEIVSKHVHQDYLKELVKFLLIKKNKDHEIRDVNNYIAYGEKEIKKMNRNRYYRDIYELYKYSPYTPRKIPVKIYKISDKTKRDEIIKSIKQNSIDTEDITELNSDDLNAILKNIDEHDKSENSLNVLESPGYLRSFANYVKQSMVGQVVEEVARTALNPEHSEFDGDTPDPDALAGWGGGGRGGGVQIKNELFEKMINKLTNDLSVNKTEDIDNIKKFLEENDNIENKEELLEKINSESSDTTDSTDTSETSKLEQSELDISDDYLNLSLLIEYLRLRELSKKEVRKFVSSNMGKYLSKDDFVNIYKEVYGDKNIKGSKKCNLLNKIAELERDKNDCIKHTFKNNSDQIGVQWLIAAFIFMIISVIFVISLIPLVQNVINYILKLLFNSVLSGMLSSFGLGWLSSLAAWMLAPAAAATFQPIAVLWVLSAVMSRLLIPQYRKIYEYGKKDKDDKKVNRGGKIRTKRKHRHERRGKKGGFLDLDKSHSQCMNKIEIDIKLWDSITTEQQNEWFRKTKENFKQNIGNIILNPITLMSIIPTINKSDGGNITISTGIKGGGLEGTGNSINMAFYSIPVTYNIDEKVKQEMDDEYREFLSMSQNVKTGGYIDNSKLNKEITGGTWLGEALRRSFETAGTKISSLGESTTDMLGSSLRFGLDTVGTITDTVTDAPSATMGVIRENIPIVAEFVDDLRGIEKFKRELRENEKERLLVEKIQGEHQELIVDKGNKVVDMEKELQRINDYLRVNKGTDHNLKVHTHMLDKNKNPAHRGSPWTTLKTIEDITKFKDDLEKAISGEKTTISDMISKNQEELGGYIKSEEYKLKTLIDTNRDLYRKADKKIEEIEVELKRLKTPIEEGTKKLHDYVEATVEETLPSGEKVKIKSTYNDEINRLSQQLQENKEIVSTHRETSNELQRRIQKIQRIGKSGSANSWTDIAKLPPDLDFRTHRDVVAKNKEIFENSAKNVLAKKSKIDEFLREAEGKDFEEFKRMKMDQFEAEALKVREEQMPGKDWQGIQKLGPEPAPLLTGEDAGNMRYGAQKLDSSMRFTNKEKEILERVNRKEHIKKQHEERMLAKAAGEEPKKLNYEGVEIHDISDLHPKVVIQESFMGKYLTKIKDNLESTVTSNPIQVATLVYQGTMGWYELFKEHGTPDYVISNEHKLQQTEYLLSNVVRHLFFEKMEEYKKRKLDKSITLNKENFARKFKEQIIKKPTYLEAVSETDSRTWGEDYERNVTDKTQEDATFKDKLVDKYQSQEKIYINKETDVEREKRYELYDRESGANYSTPIREMQKRHPNLGNNEMIWYQSNPDGNCLFIAIDASLRNDTNVYKYYKGSAGSVRKTIAQNIKDLLGKGPGIANEMNQALPKPSMIFPNPKKVTPELMDRYNKHIRERGAWGGEIEIMLAAKIYKRPIIIYYNNENPPRIFWHDGREEENYTDYSQIENEPQPIILGYISASYSVYKQGHRLYGDSKNDNNHYIYALVSKEFTQVSSQDSDLPAVSEEDEYTQLLNQAKDEKKAELEKLPNSILIEIAEDRFPITEEDKRSFNKLDTNEDLKQQLINAIIDDLYNNDKIEDELKKYKKRDLEKLTTGNLVKMVKDNLELTEDDRKLLKDIEDPEKRSEHLNIRNTFITKIIETKYTTIKPSDLIKQYNEYIEEDKKRKLLEIKEYKEVELTRLTNEELIKYVNEYHNSNEYMSKLIEGLTDDNNKKKLIYSISNNEYKTLSVKEYEVIKSEFKKVEKKRKEMDEYKKSLYDENKIHLYIAYYYKRKNENKRSIPGCIKKSKYEAKEYPELILDSIELWNPKVDDGEKIINDIGKGKLDYIIENGLTPDSVFDELCGSEKGSLRKKTKKKPRKKKDTTKQKPRKKKDTTKQKPRKKKDTTKQKPRKKKDTTK